MRAQWGTEPVSQGLAIKSKRKDAGEGEKSGTQNREQCDFAPIFKGRDICRRWGKNLGFLGMGLWV